MDDIISDLNPGSAVTAEPTS